MKQAVEEIKGIISSQYPATTFSVNPGFNPDGIYLTATVDVDDVDDI